MKTCPKCGETKPLDEFHKHRTAKDGRQARCKDCACRLAREWQRENNVQSHKRVRPDGTIPRSGMPHSRLVEIDGVLCKVCNKCETAKPLEAFYRHAAGSGGVRSECIKCSSKNAHKWSRDNVERFRANQRRHRLKKQYGMSEADWDALVLAQEGRCKICEQPADLRVDHCHTSGVVRGLLCHSCNTAIGHFRDDTAVLYRAISYLQEVRAEET